MTSIRNTLKALFLTGKIPNQADYDNVITNVAVKGDDDVSQSEAEGLVNQTPRLWSSLRVGQAMTSFTNSFKAAAQTWSGKQTFSSAPRFNSASAGSVMTVDDNKDLFARQIGNDSKDKIASGDVVISFSTKDLMVAAAADSLPNNKLVRCDEAKYSGVWQVTTQSSVTDDDRYFLTGTNYDFIKIEKTRANVKSFGADGSYNGNANALKLCLGFGFIAVIPEGEFLLDNCKVTGIDEAIIIADNVTFKRADDPSLGSRDCDEMLQFEDVSKIRIIGDWELNGNGDNAYDAGDNNFDIKIGYTDNTKEPDVNIGNFYADDCRQGFLQISRNIAGSDKKGRIILGNITERNAFNALGLQVYGDFDYVKTGLLTTYQGTNTKFLTYGSGAKAFNFAFDANREKSYTLYVGGLTAYNAKANCLFTQNISDGMIGPLVSYDALYNEDGTDPTIQPGGWNFCKFDNARTPAGSELRRLNFTGVLLKGTNQSLTLQDINTDTPSFRSSIWLDEGL